MLVTTPLRSPSSWSRWREIKQASGNVAEEPGEEVLVRGGTASFVLVFFRLESEVGPIHIPMNMSQSQCESWDTMLKERHLESGKIETLYRSD